MFVLGAGCWGFTLANMYSQKNYNVCLWEPIKQQALKLNTTRQLKNFSNIKLSPKVKITDNILELNNYNLILFVTPSVYLRETVLKIKNLNLNLKNKYLISCIKGIEENTFLTPSQIIKQVLNVSQNNIFVLSGPSHAEEVIEKKPTAITLAGYNKESLIKLQKILSTEFFRVYTNTDILGVELGGILKNVYAIAGGICDGLGLGNNAKSALLTRALKEIVSVGKLLGGQKITFFGLSGLGDLLTTAYSNYSRNRNFGEYLAKTGNVTTAKKLVKTTIEGIKTAKVLYELAKKYNLDLPIATQVYNVIHKNKVSKKDFEKIIKTLFLRKLKYEFANYL
jgi:glycerol-3-phosphate dehydrogenase (NAD(P)+)